MTEQHCEFEQVSCRYPGTLMFACKRCGATVMVGDGRPAPVQKCVGSGFGHWSTVLAPPNRGAATTVIPENHVAEAASQKGRCGPGCHAKRILASLRIQPLPGCDCEGYARQMDEWGVDGCRQHFDEIVAHFREYAALYGWTAKFQAAALAAATGLAFKLNWLDPLPDIIREAIRRAEEAEERRTAPGAPPDGPLVTVVMPTYNQGKFLRQALDSVLAQTFRDFELIVVNDGSTDDTEAVLRCYDDTRIRVITQANQGIGAALNAGFALSRGRYETWWASDNVMFPEMLASLAGYLDGHGDVDYVYANCEVHEMDAAGKCLHVTNIEKLLDQKWEPLKLSHYYFLGIAWLWRRHIREAAGAFSTARGPDYICEDYDHALRCLEAGARFAFLAKNLGWYRKHQESNSAWLARQPDPRGAYRRLIARARSRRFPRKAWCYWGEATLPYLRYATLATFCRHNPDWSVTLFRPDRPQTAKTWCTDHQRYTLDCRDYSGDLAKLPIQQRVLAPGTMGLPEGVPEVQLSDLLRLHLLATEGGVWSDMDILYFAPLNLPLDRADTYLCDGPYGHSIGLLASTPDNPVFRFLLAQATKAVQRIGHEYQAAGAITFNANRDKLAQLDGANTKVFPALGKTIHHIPMETVYAYNAMDVPAIYAEPGDGGAKFSPDSIGLHWYGAHPLAGIAQNTVTADNWGQLTSVLGVALRRAFA